MNVITKNIPNLLTGLNLAFGFTAIIMAMQGALTTAAWLLLVAAVFDFSDGFAARMLKAYSELGKQLDSLADAVSFGVAPGILAYKTMEMALNTNLQEASGVNFFLLLLPALIPVFSALRLAKFNLDTRQTTSFVGMPTPASALIFVSVVLIVANSSEGVSIYILNPWVLAILIIVDSVLMISSLPMFSLKVKSASFKDSYVQYLFALLAILMLVFFKLQALLMIMVSYVLISLILGFTGILKIEEEK